MKRIIKGLAISVSIAALSAVGFAQTETKPVEKKMERGMQKGEFGRHGKMRKHGRHGGFGLKHLNLSEAQKEQIKGIHDRAKAANQPKHEEMKAFAQKRKDGAIFTEQEQIRMRELREQAKAAHKSTRDAVMAVLTEEQRTQLNTQREEMKRRFEERRKNRAPKTETTSPQKTN